MRLISSLSVPDIPVFGPIMAIVLSKGRLLFDRSKTVIFEMWILEYVHVFCVVLFCVGKGLAMRRRPIHEI
jgi:hypothetical protein